MEEKNEEMYLVNAIVRFFNVFWGLQPSFCKYFYGLTRFTQILEVHRSLFNRSKWHGIKTFESHQRVFYGFHKIAIYNSREIKNSNFFAFLFRSMAAEAGIVNFLIKF